MKHVWTLVVLVLGVFLLGFGGVQAGYDNSLEAYTIEDEAATVDYESETNLSKSGAAESFNRSITVTVDGSELSEGDDYEWHPDRGNVSWINSTATSDGDTAFIDYQYDDHPEATQFSFEMFYLVLLFVAFMMVYVAVKFGLGGI